VSAVLHEHRPGDLGIVLGREPDEPGVVRFSFGSLSASTSRDALNTWAVPVLAQNVAARDLGPPPRAVLR